MNSSKCCSEIIGPWLYDMSSAIVAKVGRQAFSTRSRILQVEVGQVLVDAVDQFRLVVEGQADLREAHQGPREPEVAFQRDPDDGLACGLPRGPRAHRLDRPAVVGKQPRPDPQVIVHVGDDALDVVLHGLDRRIGRREPELLVGIQAEVLGDVEDRVQLGGQAFRLPAGDGLVPPHGPFPARQAIDRLEVHHGTEPFDVIHHRAWQVASGARAKLSGSLYPRDVTQRHRQSWTGKHWRMVATGQVLYRWQFGDSWVPRSSWRQSRAAVQRNQRILTRDAHPLS